MRRVHDKENAMNCWRVRVLSACFTMLLASLCAAEEPSNEEQTKVDKAREALAQQDEDADSTSQLEEVFQAAEKNYSLLKQSAKALSYSLDYSYTSDSRIDLQVVDNTIRNADVSPSARHSFTNTFSLDYGMLDNLTLSTRFPLATRYDTYEELSITDWGDISIGVRWQPFAYVPGKATITVSATLLTKTGVSPYEIEVGKQLSTGNGAYGVSAGVSVSKILDPVALFGSFSSTYTLEENGLNQIRSGRILKTVQQGQSFSLSGGFSYSLSYDVSLSMSAQLGYSTETKLIFSQGPSASAQDQINGSMNMSLGIRVDPETILNTSFGFGLTEDASDLSLGVSYPINMGKFTW